jgi:hypothetical protein
LGEEARLVRRFEFRQPIGMRGAQHVQRLGANLIVGAVGERRAGFLQRFESDFRFQLGAGQPGVDELRRQTCRASRQRQRRRRFLAVLLDARQPEQRNARFGNQRLDPLHQLLEPVIRKIGADRLDHAEE